MQSPAAWHPDPTGSHDHRWWDGERWTEHVADAGVASVDPLPGGPDAPSDRTEVLDAEDTAAGTSTTAVPTQPGPAAGETAGTEQPSWGEPPRANTPGAAQPAWGRSTTGQGDGHTGPPRAGGAAIASLVLGILALLSGIFVIGGVLGLAAIVVGAIALATASNRGGGGKGHAIAGIITGVVGIVLAVIVFGFFADITSETVRCLEETGGDEALCQERLERSIFDRFGAG